VFQLKSGTKKLFVPPPGHRTPHVSKKRPRGQLRVGAQGEVEYNDRMYRAEETRTGREGISIRFLDHPGQQVDYPAGEECRQYFAKG
jgi:hypothetical protein